MKASRINHRRTHLTNLSQSTVQPTNSSVEWLKTLGLTIAGLSGLGALYGYGVALGLSNAFGLGPGVWFNSPLELISLSGEGMLGIFAALYHFTEYLDLLLQIMLGYGAFTAILTLIAVLFAVRGHWLEKLKQLATAGVRWLLPSRSAALNRFEAWTRKTTAIGLVVLTGSTGGFFLIPVIILCLLAVTSMISLVPLIGYFSGVAYANYTVLSPDRCVSGPGIRRTASIEADRSGSDRQMKTGAHCVEVIERLGTAPLRGRLIISRPAYVIIFQPAEDRVLMIQLKDGSIKTVDGIESPTPP